MSVPVPFVWRCLSGSTIAPFPHPSQRTGRADRPHPALGQDLTPSSTARRVQAGLNVRARSARRGARVDRSRDFVLGAQPPAQPHSCVSVERPVRLVDGSYLEVVRPSAQRDHAMGLPVLRTLSLYTCCRHYPGAATGRRLRSSHPAVTAFPENVVGSACTSSFSRFAQRSLALRPAHSRGHLYVTSYTEGFSHFVTSMTAPVASGWSGCRVGLAPTGTRRLLKAHT